jgi:hypothetical protein
MLSCRSSILPTSRRRLPTGAPSTRRALVKTFAKKGVSGNGEGSSGETGDETKKSRSPSSSSKKSTKQPTAGADAEAAARDVLYTSADLAAGVVGATAGAAEAAVEAVADAADDAAAAAQGVASSLAREAEEAAEAAVEAASDFVFATASMADAAATAVLRGGEEEGQGSGRGPSSSSSSWSSSSAAATTPPPPILSAAQLKQQLVQAVAGLDRGLGASLREARAVDALARRLERAAPAADGGDDGNDSAAPLGPLAPGCWRLIYSSAFGGGSLGGSRPGPPAALTPLVLGGVFQVVDRDRRTLDNVVELLAPGLVAPKALVMAPLKALCAALGGALGGSGNDENDDEDDDPTPGVRLTLRHDYEILPPSSSSSTAAATVRIVFEDTIARALGPSFLASRLPRVSAPQLPEPLRPPRGLRAATFDVTYEDSEMRVTRGDRGELRVFLREPGRDLDAAPIVGWRRRAAEEEAAAARAKPASSSAWSPLSMED